MTIKFCFKRCILLSILTLVLAKPSSAGEFRSFWVDSWNSGFESPAATSTMVDYIKGCNGNAILLEVRKRCDSYYSSTIEPTGVSVTPQPGYDPLADTIAKAHAAGMEVHAWVVAFRVWDGKNPPAHTTPEHIWYKHPEWFMIDDSGNKSSDGTTVSLDPGCPAVEDYLIGVFMDIVKRYEVDGIVLDYIRYPGTRWGYNPTAVARFNAEYGRSGAPLRTDPLWQSWRAEQISNLVKRLYLEVKSIKPQVKVGAATWKTAELGRAEVLQNWEDWLSNRYIDYAAPMNYTTSNTAFQRNVEDSIGRQHSRHIYIAPGCYINKLEDNITQIKDAQTAGFPGAAIFSYAAMTGGTPDSTGMKNALLAGPWSSPASVPDMPWISKPSNGYIRGSVTDQNGNPIYPATVTISSQNLKTKDSGTGFYGLTDVATGRCEVTVTAPGFASKTSKVTIEPGRVSGLNFSLESESASTPAGK